MVLFLLKLIQSITHYIQATGIIIYMYKSFGGKYENLF